ncbi:MAG: hypothetical protein P8H59_09555 [Flavobacteriales bacterium]|nr:hypothetical protein [Flavobacteriales bacterium]MDG2246946.1 hypothetical protein [Flavobacteriales bacterium]
MKKETGTNWSLLVNIALISLVVYNLVFAWGKFMPELMPRLNQSILSSIQSSVVAFTFLELIGVASVFVDLVGRWEELGKKPAVRALRTLLIGLLLMGFIMKIFINFLDSAYLEN